MPNLTPQDVRNVAFSKSARGRRGYDEQEVDEFLDAVERTIMALTEEVESLRTQLGHGGLSVGVGTAPGSDSSVLKELEQIKARLTRLEAAIAAGGTRYAAGDPLFGNRA